MVFQCSCLTAMLLMVTTTSLIHEASLAWWVADCPCSLHPYKFFVVISAVVRWWHNTCMLRSCAVMIQSLFQC